MGKLQGMGVVPVGSPLWDTSFLVQKSSLTGRFLNGLIGYRARPSAVEFGAYVGYLAIGGLFLFGHRLSRRKASPAVVQ